VIVVLVPRCDNDERLSTAGLARSPGKGLLALAMAAKEIDCAASETPRIIRCPEREEPFGMKM